MKTTSLLIAIATATTSNPRTNTVVVAQQYLRAVQDITKPIGGDLSNDIGTIDDEPLLNEQSLIAQQFTVDPYATKDRMEMLINGELGLAGLRYHPLSFVNTGDTEDDDYSEVYGEFCVFETQLSKSDPSYYNTIHSVMDESEHCGEHRYTIPLSEVMEAIKNSSERKDNKVKTLQLDGMIFHQGYSGAGLISNALSGAFDSTLVVSEHTAVHSALSACDDIKNQYKSTNCSPRKQQKLVKDVITLLGRTNDENANHLYLKFESASTAYLSTLRALYPDAKWTFSYRKAEEVLSKSMERKKNMTCLKAKRNPTTALATKSSDNNLDLEELSSHEVCALHLSTLFDSAMKEHEASGTGLLISYDDLLDSSSIIIDKVLPYLGLTETNDKVNEILAVRSTSSGKKKGQAWDVSEEGDYEISQEVSDAVKKFMSGLDWDSVEKTQGEE